MKTFKLLVPMFAFVVLVFGSITAEPVYAYDTTSGCPDRFFSAEQGCQLPVIMEYQPEETAPFEVAAGTMCPERFYDAEKGCQVPVAAAYEEEFVLVKDTAEEEMIRGCPGRFFNAEQGCQVPYIIEYTP